MPARLAIVPKGPPTDLERQALLADFIGVYIGRRMTEAQRAALRQFGPGAVVLARGIGRPRDRRRRRDSVCPKG